MENSGEVQIQDGMVSPNGQRRSHAWKWALAAALLLGVIYTLSLNQIRQSEVFFNSDGGLKLTVARQMMTGGSWTLLETPGPSWAHAWYQSAEDRYPFHDPFVYDVEGNKYACFPIWFSLLTAPLDHLGGYRAAMIVPIAGVWGCWLVLAFGARRLGAWGWATALAVGWLAMCSCLSIYSAIYWEHSLAVLLAFSGVVIWLMGVKQARELTPDENAGGGGQARWMGLGGGALVGLSVFLRPELIGLAGAAGLVSLVFHRKSEVTRWLWAGLVAAGLGFMASNYLLTGAVQGVHSRGTMNAVWSERMWGSLKAFAFVPVFMPEFVLALVLGAALGLRDGARSVMGTLFGVLILSWVLTPVVTPHAGGLQWAPRYYLVLSPLSMLLTALMLGRVWESRTQTAWRSGVAVCVAVCVAYGGWKNIGPGARYLDYIYNGRIGPVKAFLDKVSPQVPVVADSQDVLLEVLPTVHARPIFTVKSLEKSGELQAFMQGHNQRYFVFLCATDKKWEYPDQFNLAFDEQGLVARMELSVIVDGWYKVYVGKIDRLN